MTLKDVKDDESIRICLLDVPTMWRYGIDSRYPLSTMWHAEKCADSTNIPAITNNYPIGWGLCCDSTACIAIVSTVWGSKLVVWARLPGVWCVACTCSDVVYTPEPRSSDCVGVVSRVCWCAVLLYGASCPWWRLCRFVLDRLSTVGKYIRDTSDIDDER